MAPDDFHPDAHPQATTISGDRGYGEWGQCIIDPASSTGERCGQPATGPHGKCRFHGGASTGPKTDGGKEKSSKNAITHGAFRKHFTADLSAGEKEAFDDAFDQLDDPDGAQDVARAAASICLLQFERSGDARFLRRFEGLCDKFGIAPADELEVSGELTIKQMFMEDLKQSYGYGDED